MITTRNNYVIIGDDMMLFLLFRLILNDVMIFNNQDENIMSDLE